MTDQMQLSLTILDQKALEAEVGENNLTADPAKRSLEYREPGTVLVLVSIAAVSGLAAWLLKPREWSKDKVEITRSLPDGEVLTYKHDRTSYGEQAPSPENIKALSETIAKALKF